MADKLTKLAKKFDTAHVWVEDTPIEVNPLVLVDCSFAGVSINFWSGFSNIYIYTHTANVAFFLSFLFFFIF